VIRIIMLDRLNRSDDPTWALAPVFLWSCVEPFIGIVCACLPTFAPFFRRWWSTVVTGKSSSSGAPNGGSSAGSHFGKGRNRREWRKTDNTDLGLHGDEVQLMNAVSGPDSMRTKESDEELGYPMTSISVREDVQITYSSAK
jgi:hypothetical protein